MYHTKDDYIEFSEDGIWKRHGSGYLPRNKLDIRPYMQLVL